MSEADHLLDDHALAAAAQADPRQFRALYERYAGRVFGYIFVRVHDRPTAEDLTAQVFLKALENIDRYQPSGSFAGWIFTIASNITRSYFRKAASQFPLDESLDAMIDDIDLPQQIERHEELSRLAALVAKLDEDRRELLRLRYASELTFAEIGEVVGKTEGAVKMALHRLLHDLQAKMEVRA
jgi:RNA polymerase sigma-70 factor, ECF subfamily